MLEVPSPAAKLQNVGMADEVRGDVGLRLGQRAANAGLGGEMDHAGDRRAGDRGFQGADLRKVNAAEPETIYFSSTASRARFSSTA